MILSTCAVNKYRYVRRVRGTFIGILFYRIDLNSLRFKYYAVDAFVRGSNDEGRRHRVEVTHRMINSGVSVPNIEPCFSAPYALKMIQLSGGSSNISWRAYFQAMPSATYLTPLTVEFALFCVHRETLRFVDIGNDSNLLDFMRLQCVLHLLNVFHLITLQTTTQIFQLFALQEPTANYPRSAQS